MKGLKITNAILLTLICMLEIFILYLGTEIFLGIFSQQTAAMLGVAFGIVFYAIFLAALAFLTIIITITTAVLNKKLKANNLSKTKFEKICTALYLQIINKILRTNC